MNEREKIHWIYAASIFSKIITLANRALLLPLVAIVLLPVDFAAFTLFLSAVAFLAGLDVGIGGGTLNKVAEAYARNDPAAIGRIFAQACTLTLSLCLLFLGAALTAHFYFGWLPVATLVFNAISPHQPVAVAAFGAAIVVQCLFIISLKVLQGIARQAWSNILGGLVNGAFALALVLFLSAGRSQLTELAQLTLAFGVCAQAFGIAACFREVWRLRRRVAGSAVGMSSSGRLLFEAVPFGVIALAAFAERESLKWVLGSAGDLTAVARFGVYAQFLLVALGMVQMLVMPYWPMLLNSAGHPAQLRATLRSALRLAGLVIAGICLSGAVAAVFGYELSLRVWGADYGWTRGEWIGFATYLVCSAPKHALFPVLVGLGGVRWAATGYTLEMVLLIAFLWATFGQIRLADLMFLISGTSLLIALPVFAVGVVHHRRRLLAHA